LKKLNESLNLQRNIVIDVSYVAGLVVICVFLCFAGCALEKMLSRDCSLVSEKQVGNLHKGVSMSRDTIGDFLTIIRNGIMASKRFVDAPYSRINFELATILMQEGFVQNTEAIDDVPGKKRILITLKYVRGESVIHEIKRCSRPGRRFYAKSSTIRPIIGGLGLSVLTTNQGVMTHKRAKRLGIGGEIMCSIW